MRYFVDTTKAEELGLSGTNLMVYSTLQLLCANGQWKLNYHKLAQLSQCGSVQTAMRAFKILFQNGIVSFQNGMVSFQNGTKSKEKKKQEKENIIIENKCGSVKKTHVCEQTPTQKQIEMMEILGIHNNVPGSTGLYKEVIKCGFLQPKTYINAMYDHYGKFGRNVANPLCAIRDWLRREKKAPALSQEEIIYLSTFFDAINQKGVCRICDLLTNFELTPTQAIFTINLPEAEIRVMDEWIADNIDRNKLKPYHRAITYRLAQQ